MRLFGPPLLSLALLAPAVAPAQPAAPAPRPAAPPDFSNLWTHWDGASREAIGREREGIREIDQEIATANASQLQALHEQGRDLGERVGEMVRTGDCEQGERLAREAGDFALVAAVRAHCRAEAVDPSPAGTPARR